MEIPKAKALIYVLTFVGYVWSGHGSGILTNLRDAVVAAEGFFGEFLSNFGDVVNKLKEAGNNIVDASLDEECFWTCPGGAKPKKNKYHTPVPNGCGPEGMKVDVKFMSSGDMTKCCNEHDICYSTCNSPKDKCDNDFKRCLYKICDSVPAAEDIVKSCKMAAKVLYTSTTALGCKFYQDAQKQACFCPPGKGYKSYQSGDL